MSEDVLPSNSHVEQAALTATMPDTKHFMTRVFR